MDYKEYCEQLIKITNEGISPIPQDWKISARLYKKITLKGEMREFLGDTSTIRLSEDDAKKCEKLQDMLLEDADGMFVRLLPQTFHITIHAFNNENNTNGSKSVLEDAMLVTKNIIKREFDDISKKFGGRTIRMRSTGVSINPALDVISIKFIPAGEADYHLITGLFDRLEGIHPLGSFFIPHVSLAYFKPKKYEEYEVKRIYEKLNCLNTNSSFDIELPVNGLAYQYHYHMNDFRDIFRVGDFL